MGLELNLHEKKIDLTTFDFWHEFDKRILNDFCLINNLGSLSAFRIRYDVLLNSNPEKAKKIFNLFLLFSSHLNEDKSNIFNDIIERKLKFLDKKVSAYYLKNRLKMNLNSCKTEKRKIEVIMILKNEKNCH